LLIPEFEVSQRLAVFLSRNTEGGIFLGEQGEPPCLALPLVLQPHALSQSPQEQRGKETYSSLPIPGPS
jgi:hypothetical protein